MKLVVKKTYCPNCRRLVRGLQEKDGGQIKLSCPICKRLLWNYNGLFWRYVRRRV